MTDFQAFLQRTHQNLATLKETSSITFNKHNIIGR